MNDADIKFVGQLARTYYYNKSQAIEPPSDIRQREFGMVRPGSTMERHMSVSDATDLRLRLMCERPLEVFVSNARYLLPEQRPMEDKAWQNADLIFDIDAKDLSPKCGRKHVVSACGMCGRPARSGCGCKCGTVSSWLPCKDCIDAAKAETARLVDVLARDFNITKPSVHFSGNEGFHVTVEGGWPAGLGRNERADLADYLLANDLRPDRVGITTDTKNPPRAGDPGMRGRFAAAAGLRGAKARARARMMAADERLFREATGQASIRIDPCVTSDIRRIFRLPGSINGKSGLAKVRVDDMEAFDPYTDAVVLPDHPVAVTAWCPKFALGGQDIGPCDGESVVPAYAAAWLICRGLGHHLE